jgi:hypothetical protein
MDRVTATLTESLRAALGGPAEQRLYRSGKLPGVFASRAGAAAEAAALALREGLLEVARTETKGKTVTDWVRFTPKGLRFVHDHDSPARAMDELRDALRVTREGLPAWVAEMRQGLEQLSKKLAADVQAISARLDALSRRVEEVLSRTLAPPVPEETARAVPWARDAVDYLDRRHDGGVPGPCPLAELFAAVREPHGELSLADFHAGLRRLHERGVVRLAPSANGGPLPEPEYALLDGAATYYYVTRRPVS